MKDEAQQRRAEALRGFSVRERLEFYQKAHERLLRQQQQMDKAACIDEPSKGIPGNEI